MTFEIKERDLLARIGKLKIKSGTVETPLLFPVIIVKWKHSVITIRRAA